MSDNLRDDTSNFWGLDLWIIRCDSCGYEGITYRLSDFGGYVRALGRTCLGELAELNAWDTPAYDELIELLKAVMGRPSNLRPFWGRRDKLFGLIADPAPSGERYDFTEHLCCRRCRGNATKIRWGEWEPGIEAMTLLLATHREWDSLSRDDKLELIEEALRSWELH